MTPDAWLWGDVGNYYGAGPWGLNYHQNLYLLTFRPGVVGAAAQLVSAYPTPHGVRFENEMKIGTSGSGDQGYVYGGPHAEVITLQGTLPAGRSSFSIKGGRSHRLQRV